MCVEVDASTYLLAKLLDSLNAEDDISSNVIESLSSWP